MKTNVGTIDTVVRILIALIVIGLYFMNVVSGTLAIVLLVVAGVFFITGLVKFCPLYMMLGINSGKKKVSVK
ncbi:MAG: DUF2892 domain-containing protein [Paludibacter sp.]|nr:DUF2892 domain-containing protein [Paludibacter sp.]